jgi:hypothetical protein
VDTNDFAAVELHIDDHAAPVPVTPIAIRLFRPFVLLANVGAFAPRCQRLTLDSLYS